MLTILRFTDAPCIFCQSDSDTMEITVDGKSMTLCKTDLWAMLKKRQPKPSKQAKKATLLGDFEDEELSA